jgi:hypothetical protein
MRCPRSRPATISCRQGKKISKRSGGAVAGVGVAAGIAAGGAGEGRRASVAAFPLISDFSLPGAYRNLIWRPHGFQYAS